MLQISWEEPIIPFSPIPPFIVPIWVPPCNDVEVGKSIDQISIPSSQPSSISHDLDPSEDNLEWFMNVKVNLTRDQIIICACRRALQRLSNILKGHI